jgi:hypothetical protein
VSLRSRTALAAVLGVLAVPAVAGPARAHMTVPFGAHETFGGAVNGATSGARIRMACFGQIRPGRLGHPMTDQTVGVFIPEVLTEPYFGHTGGVGGGVVVSIVTDHGTIGPLARFRRLVRTGSLLSASAPLRTDLLLPCSGHATMRFVPVPGSAGAVAATVDVIFSSPL